MNPTDPTSATLARAREVLDKYQAWQSAPVTGRAPAESIATDVALALESLLDLVEDLDRTGVSAGGLSGRERSS